MWGNKEGVLRSKWGMEIGIHGILGKQTSDFLLWILWEDWVLSDLFNEVTHVTGHKGAWLMIPLWTGLHHMRVKHFKDFKEGRFQMVHDNYVDNGYPSVIKRFSSMIFPLKPPWPISNCHVWWHRRVTYIGLTHQLPYFTSWWLQFMSSLLGKDCDDNL